MVVSSPDADDGGTPDVGSQRRFWDSWNTEHRTSPTGDDPYRARQLQVARRVADGLVDEAHRALRICDFGSGTGWLGAALRSHGAVTATDLSPSACDWGRAHYPDIDFVEGDLLTVELPAPFDLVVSADVISHVADQDAFVARVASLLRPDGVFLLMTQNERVWLRNSGLAPPAPGQIRNWPSLTEVRELLDGRFSVERVGTIHPIGDLGVHRIVNSRWLSGPLRRVGLGEAWTRVRERARLGCEYTVEARRT